MPAKPSAKLTGARRVATTSKRNQSGPLIVSPTRLGDITLDRETLQALTLAEAKVVITLSAGGNTASLVSTDTGKEIGGVDDLAKLSTLRSFVTKEKKVSTSSEHRKSVMTAAMRLSMNEKANNSTFDQKVLDNGFIVAAKPYQLMCTNLRAHVKSIGENFGTSDEYKNILTGYCRLTESVLVNVLAAMIRGEKEKGLLEDLSFEARLPAYIRNKLVTKSLSLPRDADLSRILFPSDPSKGLTLTVKEWRSEGFVKALGPLACNTELVACMIQDTDLFLELIGMTAEQFSNAEDPRVQRVLKTRIHVVPPFEDHERVLSLLERPTFRGFGLPATAMDQSKDRLTNICAVPLRAYAFSVRMAETIPDFYDRILPKGTIKAPDDKLGNYAKQALSAIKDGTKCKLIPILRGIESADAFMAWVYRECKIIPNGDLATKIKSALSIEDEGMTVGLDLPDSVVKPPTTIVDVVSKPINATELAAIDEFVSKTFSFREKDTKKKRTAASSVLLRETRVFLKHVRREHSDALAESMEAFFRGFYAEGIQSAAVRIAEARFDEFDDEVIGSSGEESTDSEDDD